MWALRTDLELWAQKSVASKQDIASIHGRLSFVVQVAKPGTIFLHWMVEEMQTVQGMDDRIFLSAKFLVEVHWWWDLLPEWSGVSLILDQQWTANADFDLWTDALGAGFGAYWNGAYLLGEFAE